MSKINREEKKDMIRRILWDYKYLIKPYKLSEYIETVIDLIMKLRDDGKI